MKKKNRYLATVVATVMAMSVLASGCGKSAQADDDGLNTVAIDQTEPTESSDEAKDQSADDSADTQTGTDQTAADAQKAQSDTDAQSQTTQDAGASDKDAAGASDKDSTGISITQVDKGDLNKQNIFKEQGGSLPEYEYPGPELFYTVVYDYIADVLGDGYLPGDVTIPCPVIVAEDESNKSDILVYGNFCVYNYTLGTDGETLMTISGGSHPGLMHLESTDDGYRVTGFDAVADGSDFEPSAKKIFGSYYEDFQKKYSDDKLHEETRAQIISNYAAANNLPITGYQDYGWEKKALPTENIDSFYSILN